MDAASNGMFRRGMDPEHAPHPRLISDVRHGRGWVYLAPMFGSIKDQLTQELADIEAAGLYKRERVITSSSRGGMRSTMAAPC